MRLLPLTLALSCLALASPLFADPVCAKIFGDHMVLQRDKPVRIWGTADVGEIVAVDFDRQKVSTTTNAEGKWAVTLKPMKASSEPRMMIIGGKNSLTLHDVLVGEVWLCSGQSNMEKPLGPRQNQRPTDNHLEVLTNATHPLVRLYQVPRHGKVDEKRPSLTWLPCDAESLNNMVFSAAAYFFGAELSRELGVPIGLVHSSYGGTRIEPWTPIEGFAPLPELKDFAESSRKRQKFDGVEASSLYHSMIEPMVPLTLRGAIWYQGESNSMNGDGLSYTVKMKALIEGWRKVFQDKNLPFYYVHLAPYAYSTRKSSKKSTTEALPLTWDAQVAALKIPKTGLVATIDITSDIQDIHPTNKKDVGVRLAHLALAKTYGRKNLVVAGPSLKRSKVKDGAVHLRFTQAEGLKTRDGKTPSHFMVAGDDRKFFPAQGYIEKDTVIVSSPQVSKPVAVRFAWHETALPNLINGAGLPALPFRTDAWPVEALQKLPEQQANKAN